MLKVTLKMYKKIYSSGSSLEVVVDGKDIQPDELLSFKENLSPPLYQYLLDFVVCHEHMHSPEFKAVIKKQ